MKVREPGENSRMAKLTLNGEIFMWYVIQTNAGKEQELANAIELVLFGDKKEETYKRCFVLYHECIWRIEGEYRIHIEPLFPSYVFVETDDPDAFFIALKQVPKLAKLLGADGKFWSIGEEEERFLDSMIKTEEGGQVCISSGKKNRDRAIGGRTKQYLVRRSLVYVDPEGQIVGAEGILKNYLGQIVKKRLRKRSVIIEAPFLGEMRRIQLGIRLADDRF